MDADTHGNTCTVGDTRAFIYAYAGTDGNAGAVRYVGTHGNADTLAGTHRYIHGNADINAGTAHKHLYSDSDLYFDTDRNPDSADIYVYTHLYAGTAHKHLHADSDDDNGPHGYTHTGTDGYTNAFAFGDTDRNTDDDADADNHADAG